MLVQLTDSSDIEQVTTPEPVDCSSPGSVTGRRVNASSRPVDTHEIVSIKEEGGGVVGRASLLDVLLDATKTAILDAAAGAYDQLAKAISVLRRRVELLAAFHQLLHPAKAPCLQPLTA